MKVKQLYTNKIVVALLAIMCCFLWGSAFPAVKIGYQIFHIPMDNTWLKIMFAGYRFFLASIFILLFAYLSKQKMSFGLRELKHFIILGLVSTTISYMFFYLGLSRTAGVKASVLNSTMTFFTVIIAHYALANDKINKNKIVGLLLGFTGVVLANFSFEILRPSFALTGEGFLLFSILAGSIGTVYVKKVSNFIPVIILTGYQMLIGSLMMIIPAAWQVGFFPFHFNTGNLLLYLYLALLSAVAFSVWNTIIKYNTVGKVAIYQFLIPIFGSLLSALFLSGEKITNSTVLALILVSAGIISVNQKETVADKRETSNAETS